MVRHAATALLLLATIGLQSIAQGNETVLLDFASPQCPPCRQMEPTIHGLQSAGYPIRKVDVTREQQLGAQYNVTRVPCFVMLAGGREIDRVVGATSQQRIEMMFQRARDELARQNADRIRSQSPDASQPVAATRDPWSGASVPASTPIAPSGASQPPTNSLALNTPPSTLSVPAVIASSPADAAVSSPQLAALVSSSVRLRVEDSKGHAYGTGTIIDARSGEALVITCGHLFRESKGQGPITVELFEATPNGVQPVGQVAGNVISYDLDRDLGLVSIRPGRPVQIAPIAPPGTTIDRGNRVASVGCSNGENPSVLPTRVTALDRYQGPPNVEAAGAPVEGRSGGGLFNEQGQLIGVCFAADPEGNEGLYSALESIHGELERIGLSAIYSKPPGMALSGDSVAAVDPTSVAPVVRGQEPQQPLVPLTNSQPASPLATPGGTLVAAEPAPISTPPNLNAAEQAAMEELLSRAVAAEVICIIRPKEPGGQSEVITLDQVSPEFVQALAARRRNFQGKAIR